jgi:hypothetical protein
MSTHSGVQEVTKDDEVHVRFGPKAAIYAAQAHVCCPSPEHKDSDKG